MRMVSAVLIGAVMGSVSLPQAQALEANLSALYRTEYSHNISRVEDSEAGDNSWSHLPGLAGSFIAQGASSNIGLNYTVQRQMYTSSDTSDQTIASGDGFARWSPVQDRWNLFINNTLSYTTIDDREANTPDNTQLVSYTNAGTDISLPLFSTHYLTANASYGTTGAQRTDTNSDRYFASVGYGIDLSELNQIAITTGYTSVKFDNPTSDDYEDFRVSADYSSSTRILDLFLSGGYSEIDREGFEEKVDGFVGGVDLTWKITESSSLGFTLSQNFQDNYNPGGSLRAVGVLQNDEVTSEPTDEELEFPDTQRTDLNDVYRSRVLLLVYNTAFGLTTLSLGGSYSTRVYDENEAENEDRTSVFARAGRQLAQSSQIHLTVSWDDIDYEETSQNDQLTQVLVSYSLAPWRRLTLTASASYEHRNSNVDSDSDYYSGSIGLDLLLYGYNR